MRTLKGILFGVLSFVGAQMVAQGQVATGYFFSQRPGPQFFDGSSNPLENACAGGFEYPVFAGLDVNLDGIEDLLVRDYDQTTRVFLGNGDTDNPHFSHAPEYEALLPPLNSWVVTIDFNKDGLKDIFTHDGGGNLKVFQNTTNNGSLSFKQPRKLFKYYDPRPEYKGYVWLTAIVYLSGVVDVNADGDVDLLSFNSGGDKVYYFENQSMEKYGHADSIDYVMVTDCWGYFEESETDHTVRSVEKCGSFKKKDGGSHMLPIDLDGDNDQDLLLSHYLYNGVLSLINGRDTIGHDVVVDFESSYPKETRSIDIDLFPSMCLVDVNFDGKEDLLCAPTATGDSLYVENNWLYKNVSTGPAVEFDFVSNDFLHDGMLDHGGQSIPAFFDYDADGDQDLFVASAMPLGPQSTHSGHYRIFQYENVGSATNAQYQLINWDYMGVLSRKLTYAFPTFGDADNDGSTDLLIGTQGGRIIFYHNQSKPGAPAQFAYGRNRFMNINSQDFIMPHVADINSDGKNDLLVGTKWGKIDYYEWKNDSLELITNEWGGVALSYAVAPSFGDFDNDGKNELIVGDRSGKLWLGDDVGLGAGNITLSDQIIQNTIINGQVSKDLGSMLTPAVADLNGDTLSDIILGMGAGGLLYLEGGIYRVGLLEQEGVSGFELWPNPTNSQMRVQWSDGDEELLVSVFDMQGKEVITSRLDNGASLDVSALPEGIYALFCHDHQGKAVGRKFVKR